MVSKKFTIVFVMNIIFLLVASSAVTTQNATNLYDAVSLVDVWQPEPSQDHKNYDVSHEPHLRKRT